MEPGETVPVILTAGLFEPVSSKVTLSRLKNLSELPAFFQSAVVVTSHLLVVLSPAQIKFAALPVMLTATLPAVDVSKLKVWRVVPAPATARLPAPPDSAPV